MSQPLSDPSQPASDTGSPSPLMSMLIVVVFTGLIGGGAFWGWNQFKKSTAVPGRLIGSEVDESTMPKPTLSEFSLTESSGDTFQSKSLEGDVWVASFFFSQCTASCWKLNEKVKGLKDEFGQQGVKFVSITCDPDKDTPAALKKYAKSFRSPGDDWYFLTGKLPYIQRLSRDIFKEGITEKGHSDRIHLVDHKGTVRGYFDVFDPRKVKAARELLAQLVKERAEQQPAQDRTADSPVKESPAS
jgi:protein SCO1/2